MRPTSLLLLAALTAGCVDPGADDTAPSAPNQLRDDKSDGGDPLWAGLTSVTIERYTADPCNNGSHALGDTAVVYEEWARQRAAIRNVCFEVWSPGVTDWDNPDFWRQLDVQVHYRFGHAGAFTRAYVPSIDRRGNNRRYAWAFGAFDPIPYVPSVPAMTVPFDVLSVSNGWAQVAAELEFYFTVNGRVLEAPSSTPFGIRYVGHLRAPTLDPNPAGYVLYDQVTCAQGAVRFGSGAGYFAVDVRDQAAIATLGAGLDGSLIYGTGVARSGSPGDELLSMIYTQSITVPGEALPGYVDRGGLRIVPAGTSMRIELDAYDRQIGATRTLVTTFTGCVATATL